MIDIKKYTVLFVIACHGLSGFVITLHFMVLQDRYLTNFLLLIDLIFIISSVKVFFWKDMLSEYFNLLSMIIFLVFHFYVAIDNILLKISLKGFFYGISSIYAILIIFSILSIPLISVITSRSSADNLKFPPPG